MPDASLQRIPALGSQRKLGIVSCDELRAESLLRDMPDKPDVLNRYDFLMIADGHGEEQLIVFAAV